MDGRPLLIDVRQIGPDKERDISGVCSACGATLLARLRNDVEKPTPERLHSELEAVFERHAAEKHPFEGKSAVNHWLRLCHKMKSLASKAFTASEFWEPPASKGSTTCFVWPP